MCAGQKRPDAAAAPADHRAALRQVWGRAEQRADGLAADPAAISPELWRALSAVLPPGASSRHMRRRLPAVEL